MPIIETNIRQIYNLILSETRKSYATGKYRDIKVIVGKYTPPPIYDIQILMKEFSDWLNAPQEYSTFLFEGTAHYRFVEIHPLVDGNSRTTRLLTKLILIKGGYKYNNYRPHYALKGKTPSEICNAYYYSLNNIK